MKKTTKKAVPVIGIGTYLASDYEAIRQISSDTDNWCDTWDAWLKNKTQAQQHLMSAGIKTVDVVVKPDELAQYCQERGVKINGESRAQFVQWKVERGQY